MKDIIKAKRLALGLSQENLAKQLGVKRVTVSQWEAGRNTPKTKMLQEIAKALKWSADDLLRQEAIQTKNKKPPCGGEKQTIESRWTNEMVTVKGGTKAKSRRGGNGMRTSGRAGNKIL